MRKAGKSYSHICSTSLAFERYMEFIGKPMKLGRPKAPRSLIRGVLSEAEVVLLLAAAQNLREKAMLALLAYGGLRTKELCRLKVGDIDLGSQIVNIVSGKGNKDRLVNIAGACVGVLSAYLQERNGKINDSLFLTRWGKRQYQPQNLRKLVRKAAQRAGLSKRVYPYLLRHSLATNLLHRGANILAIKEQLGHAWVSTTMIYIHSAPQRMKMEYHMYAPSYL
jgi:integrase/recombinase XerD